MYLKTQILFAFKSSIYWQVQMSVSITEHRKSKSKFIATKWILIDCNCLEKIDKLEF